MDYSRAPDATDPNRRGPAIDSAFEITSTDPFFWTSTTHVEHNRGSAAVYIAFGRAWGYMQQPPGWGQYVLLNVHGAGAQRSDPKSGDPNDYPFGRGAAGRYHPHLQLRSLCARPRYGHKGRLPGIMSLTSILQKSGL